MSRTVVRMLPAILLFFASHALRAQISSFQHIVIVVQENRTPDNLFQGLCKKSSDCSINPTNSQFNIQTAHWLDKTKKKGITEPLRVDMDASYDLDHTHGSFVKQCDLNTSTHTCLMDGSADVLCFGKCISQPQFRYIDNTTGILDPYLSIATQYGWANYMFQTNQGPSFPAHQFLFGASSAPSTADDAAGIFAAENVQNSKGQGAGCNAISSTTVMQIAPPGTENQAIYPCFEHNTVPDVLPSTVSWRYYAPNPNSIWTAPNAIRHICRPDKHTGGTCVGPEWVNNVDLRSADVLEDVEVCNLRSVSWVIPSAQNSDHANNNSAGGPSWVASIINAIGQSTCKNPDGSTYWDSTAILVTWDDWGGWYDHEAPTILAQPQGDYQYGFRVPLLFVSAYTPAGFIENGRHDFGSMIRFVEHNFGVREGILNFADARSKDDLSTFFNLKTTARPFVPIPARLSAAFFLNDSTPQGDPDDD